MAQLAPYLKPQGAPPKGFAPAEGGGGDGRPQLPIAGFWRRFAALLFDFMLLWGVMRVAGWVFLDQMLAAPNLAGRLAVIAAFLYFALGNGPVGGGRTVGKVIVGIRTTDLDGNAPTFLQGVLRTAILFPAFAVSLLVKPLLGGSDSFAAAQWTIILQSYLTLAVLIGCVFAIIFNPFRQGFHDYWAKTLVRPAGAPQLSFDEITAIISGGWQRLQKQAQINGSIPAVVVFLFAMMINWPSKIYEEGFGQRFEIEQALLAEVGLAPAEVVQVRLLPAEEDWETREAYERFAGEMLNPDSFAPIRIQARVDRRGRWGLSESELQDRARMFAAGYRAAVFGEIPPEKFFARMPDPPTNFDERPMIVEVLLGEYLSLFLFPIHLEQIGAVAYEAPPLRAPQRRPAEAPDAADAPE